MRHFDLGELSSLQLNLIKIAISEKLNDLRLKAMEAGAIFDLCEDCEDIKRDYEYYKMLVEEAEILDDKARLQIALCLSSQSISSAP